MSDRRVPPSVNRLLKGAILAALCVGSGVIGASFTQHFGTSKYTLSYADFVSIMLTAASLLMTVLAIFLAVVGFLGWTTIEQKVHTKTEDFLSSGFRDDGRLMEMMNDRLSQAADKKTEEILKIIERRVIEETQYFSFMGIDSITKTDAGTAQAVDNHDDEDDGEVQ